MAFVPEFAILAPKSDFRYILFMNTIRPISEIPMLVLAKDQKEATVAGMSGVYADWPARRMVRSQPLVMCMIESGAFAAYLKSLNIICPVDNHRQTLNTILRAVGDEWIMKEGIYYFRNDKPKYLLSS